MWDDIIMRAPAAAGGDVTGALRNTRYCVAYRQRIIIIISICILVACGRQWPRDKETDVAYYGGK